MKLLIVIGLLVIFGILYFFFQQNEEPESTLVETGSDSVEPSVESVMERKVSLDDSDDDKEDNDKNEEGFTASASQPAPAPGSASQPAPAPGSASRPAPAPGSASGPYNSVVDRRANLADLKELRTRIEGDKLNLQANGSLDAETTRRLANLSNVSDFVSGYITKVEDKSLKESDIPFMKSEVDNFLRALNTVDQPLPDIMAGKELKSILGNILPSNLNNDAEVTKTVQDYIKSMATNLSWYFGFKYTSDAEKNAAKHYNRRAGQAGEGDSDFYADNFTKASAGYEHQPDNYMDQRQTTDEFANMPHEAGRGPGQFDWKRRSDEICKAIKGRGLNPEEYGCMPEKTEVSKDFSYRGYANMVCTRVAANYDTGLGSLVGCPPLDWPGWRLP
jgi:hypothetical protein